MKTRPLFFMLLLLAAFNRSSAQHVRVRLGFPSGIAITAPGPAPFRNAVWIGPEWQWRAGRYVHVPGYWANPRRFGATWVPGHWRYTRKGYRWVPGHWR